MFGLLSISAFSQKDEFAFAHIDAAVKAYEQSTPAKLVGELVESGQSDREKVIAIFRWITENISYNTVIASRRKSSMMIFDDAEDDDTGTVLKPLNLRVAETVLRRKMGVCDGYARLFKTMCDFAGVPSKTITGYARTGWDRRRTKFGSNHSWNAVYIDSAWHLLDVTWASGHTSLSGDLFFRKYDDRYFLTSPEQFIIDHYPDNVRWTLLNQTPPQPEFNHSPFRYIGYIKMGIQSYSPSRGIIDAAIGDSIRFEVLSPNPQGVLEVVSGEQPEDTIPNDDVPVIYGGRRKSFTYHVTADSQEWLYVICKGYVVLRYKLNIKKRPEPATLARD